MIKNHTSYEKKLFKVAGLEQSKKQTANSDKTSAMAKFNYRGADEEDINGLVDRDES